MNNKPVTLKRVTSIIIATVGIILLGLALVASPYVTAYPGLSNNVGLFTGAAGTTSISGHDSVLPWNAGCSFAGLDGIYYNNVVAGNWDSNYLALPRNQTDTKTKFRDFLKNKYDNNICGSWSRIGVAFIVHTMLGHAPGSSTTTNLYANSNGYATVWDEFNARIINNGSINMSGVYLDNPLQNSYQRGHLTGGTQDGYFYNGYGSKSEPMYRFTGPGGYWYGVKLRCGNPAGDINVPPPITKADASTYSVSAQTKEYEKGTGGTSSLNFSLAVGGTIPCDYTIPSGSVGDTVTWRVSGSGVNTTITTRIANCTGNIYSTSPGSYSGKTATYTLNFSGLDGWAPNRYVYSVQITGLSGISSMSDINGGTLSANGSLTVFEAPFTRFYGNDTYVCGDGSNNRFTIDTANQVRGSFSEYATFFQSNNNPSSGMRGLNSSAVNSGFPAALRSNWSALTPATCVSGMNNSDLDSDAIQSISSGTVLSGLAPFSNKKTYTSTGDIVIASNIVLDSVASDPSTFTPSTFPVVLIYAEGDIFIDASVTRIDAVLVANGEVNTCKYRNNGTTTVLRSQLDEYCDSQLVINGAISAKDIKFRRAFGSRLLTSTSVTDTSQTAEVIRFPWYLHYVNLGLADTSAGRFDAYYSLPPRL